MIGKGGETIRGMQEEFEAEIDIDDDGTVRVYAPSSAQVEGVIKRIESMTREAEVGDHFPTAKVVKTTTFGAFVELVKGTDGLLHISNVKPGERVDTVESVLSQGDEIDVTVAEVDKERGRIGLRLSDDPAIAGKTPGGAAEARHGRPDDGRRRRPRRSAATAATAADAAAARRWPRWSSARAPGLSLRRRAQRSRGALPLSRLESPRRRRADHARLGPPGRDRGRSLGALGGPRPLGQNRIA